MASRRSWWIWLLAALAVAEGIALAALLVRSSWRERAEGSAVARGHAVAERMGCFACHGPGGIAGIPNPGAKDEDVPSWSAGTALMYLDKADDARGWILDGHPPGRKPDAGALLKMPAFRGRLSPADLDALVAYVLAVQQFDSPADPRISAGEQAAQRLGCTGCHGPEGRGLLANPGSFKGYVPPWEGDDYAELVQSDKEFRQWVENGISDRFRANPAARRILDTQAIRMPAYGDRVSDQEMEALLAYVKWVRANPRGGRARGQGGER
jgi:mono/diheme cytochrome c family protein